MHQFVLRWPRLGRHAKRYCNRGGGGRGTKTVVINGTLPNSTHKVGSKWVGQGMMDHIASIHGLWNLKRTGISII